MYLHRNSQKRIFRKGASYFITTVTMDRYPYFNEDSISGLLAEEIEICRQLKNFKLYGYKINPDHVHLLLRPCEAYNYSEIMRSLKTNFSRNVNRLMNFPAKAESRDPAFVGNGAVSRHCLEFPEKYGITREIPPFRWQSSFHDHVIRDQDDFLAHLKYIQKQWVRHGLNENKWCFIAACRQMHRME